MQIFVFQVMEELVRDQVAEPEQFFGIAKKLYKEPTRDRRVDTQLPFGITDLGFVVAIPVMQDPGGPRPESEAQGEISPPNQPLFSLLSQERKRVDVLVGKGKPRYPRSRVERLPKGIQH